MINNIKEYVNSSMDELCALHRELCLIPAPSLCEERRAEFCRGWFDKNCGEGAYIDEAKNVIFPYRADGADSLTVFCAHTDTVFPDTEPMPYIEEGDYIRSPGVCDDTASLAVMMMCAKYFVKNNIKTEGGVLFVANSGEEGLGNLLGTRAVFSAYGDRIKRFVSYDSTFPDIANRSVGSHRYLVEVKTEGGHSWLAFGKKSAICELSRIISALYSIEIPKKEGARATLNVGTIEGGTSVNTIAEGAKMLCEYRSDDRELLAFMEAEFERIFDEARCDGVSVSAERVGERPCMGEVDPVAQAELENICARITEEVRGVPVVFKASSTDANIPHSLGIPALAVAVVEGGGLHTRDEWMYKPSLVDGLEICIKISAEVSGIKD